MPIEAIGEFIGVPILQRQLLSKLLAEIPAIEGATGSLYNTQGFNEDNKISDWVFKTDLGIAVPIGIQNIDRVTDTVRATVIFDTNGNGLGSEEHTDDNAAADFDNEVNSIGSFTGSVATPTSVADPAAGGGSFAIEGTAGAGANPFIALNFTAIIGRIYRVEMGTKRGATGVDQAISAWSGVTVPTLPNIPINSNVTYQKDIFFVEALNTTVTMRWVVGLGGGHAGESLKVDRLSFREVSDVTTFSIDDASVFTILNIASVWRSSAASTVGLSRRIVNINLGLNQITVDGAAVKVFDGDTIQTDNELGPLADIANGGLYVPTVGVFPEFVSALNIEGFLEGDGVSCFFAGSMASVLIPTKATFIAVLDVENGGAGTGSGYGIGTNSESSNEAAGAAHVRLTGTWRRGAFSGLRFAPSLSGTSTTGTPGSEVDVKALYNIDSNGDGTSVSISEHMIGGGLSGGIPSQSANVIASGVGLGPDGPADGIRALVSLIGGGTLSMKIKKLEVVWSSA